MSNSHHLIVTSDLVQKFKENYLVLISEGYSEMSALGKLDFPKSYYIKLILDGSDFAKDVEDARKLRADLWIGKIIQDIDVIADADSIGGERLRFDKLQYLAKADNPDRYGTNSKKLAIGIDFNQFKLLPPDEALKSLSEDPFAIEAVFTEIEEDLL